ncbi:MAG: DegV family protein [Chloroflexi bacterium]|nr:DegV family protein [Chloroflexota bacterium]
MAVRILTDSTANLTPEMCQRYGIRTVSLQVTWGNESFREEDLTNEQFYPMMEARGIPASSLPVAGEMRSAMIEAVEAGDAVLGIFISSWMSGTFENARMIAQMVRDSHPGAQIAVVDSRSNCLQEGFSAIAAARVAQAGGTLEECEAAARDMILRSRFVFIPKTLTYLRKGGRMGTAAALLADLLKIVPVLTVEDGMTQVHKKVRTRRVAQNAMLDSMLADFAAHGKSEVVVHHINCIEDAREYVQEVAERTGITPEIVDIGPVIGLHVGPGAIGLVYTTERPLR